MARAPRDQEPSGDPPGDQPAAVDADVAQFRREFDAAGATEDAKPWPPGTAPAAGPDTLHCVTGRQFAFGYYRIGECLCPAVAAGLGDEMLLLPVAKRYDTLLARRMGTERGAVDEPMAREAWQKAVRESQDLRHAAELGELVSEHLGWTTPEARP